MANCLYLHDSYTTKELGALRGFFAPPPPYEAKIKTLVFTNLFLLVYLNNDRSVKVSIYFDFYHCCGHKIGWRLEIDHFVAKLRGLKVQANTKNIF